MTPSFFTTYNLPDLTYVRIYDNSVYDNTMPIYSINATRLMFTTVNSTNAAETNISEIVAYKEYIVTNGTITIDGVVYTIGQYIYLANNYTLSTGQLAAVTITETGYYGVRSTFLPSSGTYVEYSPSQMIYNLNQATYTDNAITLRYELYKTKTGAGSVTVSSSTQFIVIGTQNDSILIGSSTYYVGEVFTKSTTFTFSNVTGTNYVVAFENSVTNSFRTWGENWQIWASYFNTISTSYQVTADYMAKFLAVTARINECALYENQQFGVSLQGIQDLMNDVNLIP